MKKLLLLLLLGIAVPAFAGSITITLNPTVEVYPPGYATALCQVNGTAPCVVFSGTITDTNTDGSFLSLESVALDPAVPADDFFTLDNLFYNDGPRLFSGLPFAPGGGNPPPPHGPPPLLGIVFPPKYPNG